MKYYHIMPIKNIFFNESIIKMINENNEFDKNEHYFIVTNKELYDSYKNGNNIIYDERIHSYKKIKIIKEYVKKSDYVFLHSNYLRVYEIIFLSKKYLKKIIWGVWGHDLYDVPQKENPNFVEKFKCLIKDKIFKKIKINKTKQFYGAGIGFSYDALEIRKKYKNMKILPLLYGYKKGTIECINKVVESKNNDKNKPLKIMIGHSAFPFLNHKKILDLLYKYRNENILISLPLNYGNMKYAEEVKKYAEKKYGNKIEIIDKNMPYEDYLKYINNVDICILDFKHQAALGNLWILLKTNTKLFLNKDGIIKLSMLLEGIEAYNVELIDQMSFYEFSKPLKKPENGVLFANKYLDEMNAVKKFKDLLLELESDKKGDV